MALPTLLNSRNPLADTTAQRALLDSLPLRVTFSGRVAAAAHEPLVAQPLEILQVNVGKRCNQACRHCHVDAGPDRTEVMAPHVVEACLSFLAASRAKTLDITGGAPELHPHFKAMVIRARQIGRHVIDRCNLTITRLPNYADIPEFLAAHQVEVVASLPSFAERQTDSQRGDGVFRDSVAALRRFNDLGYGQEGSGLILNLVTNPVGAFLPAPQKALEADWKRDLWRRHGVVFNNLYTITNMPISRYLEYLQQSGNLIAYLEKLVAAFNPAAIDGLMCRNTLSVGWDGTLYDCDFNQMLDLSVDSAAPQTIFGANEQLLTGRRIIVGPHCFGCTAGGGSSCGGQTVSTARPG